MTDIEKYDDNFKDAVFPRPFRLITDEEKQDYFTKKYIEPVGEQMRRNLGLTSKRDKHFKLCLVLDNQAWFTTQDVTKQWGDDWDDAPYEHNAGPPYEWEGSLSSKAYDIKKVYWESDMYKNRDNSINSNFSVETINSMHFGWIYCCTGNRIDKIKAGTTLAEFKKLVDVYERCE